MRFTPPADVHAHVHALTAVLEVAHA